MLSLAQLDSNELEAFAILLKMVLRADGRLSDEELDLLDTFMDEVGEETWHDVFDGGRTRFVHIEQLTEVAARVQRQDVRRALHERLCRVAGSDGLADEENAILNGLAGAWGLRVSPPPRRRV